MPDGPGPWNDFGKSVSKSGPFDIDSLKTKLTSASSLVQSTVQSITGEATNLLKDKVFINKDGLLFAQGELMKTISTVDKNLIQNIFIFQLINYTTELKNFIRKLIDYHL